MTRTIIALSIGALLGYSGGYQIQQHRIDTMEADREKQVLANVQQSAADNARRASQVASSQNAATARLGRLRDAASSSRAELERLRRLALYTSADADTSNAPTTGTERTDTRGELLLECGDSLQTLAAKADRHASDAVMLLEAWPR